MANAVEIANAYVALTVRAPGIKGATEKILGGSDVSGVFDRAGTNFGQRMTGSINKVFKAGALALGGVLAAGIGTALVKGFQRLDAIDTAQAKLRGLGHDAGSVSKIMDNALASVKGTAFGLGDAATVAAQAVAAGIKPGKDLEGILKTVANSAAAAGTDLGEMGSIFSKAMTQANGVQNDVIGQLADKGIPIYQELGKVLGVTAGEVFKLASDGKINFDQFAQAAQSATGTVAAEMGTTWSGMWNNALAAAGRFGEKLIGGIFPQLKGGLGGLTEWMDSIGPAAEEMGEKLGAFVADIIPKLVDGFKVAGSVIKDVFGWMKANSDWLVPVAVAIGTLVAGIYAWVTATNIMKAAQLAFNVVMNANPIMLIVTAIAALVAGLVYFFTQTELGKAIWEEFTRFLGEAWANISGFFTSAWENVIQPVFQKIGEIAIWLYENVLKPVFDGISAVVQFFAAGFKLQFDLIVNAFRLVGAIANWLWVNALQPAFAAIGAVVTWLWTTIIQPYLNAWGALFQWLWENVLSPVFGFIGAGVQAIGNAFNWLWVNVISPVWNGISSTISTVWKWIDQNVFTPFKIGIGYIGTAFENVAKAIGIAWDGIKKAAAVPINFVLDTVWNHGLRSFWNDMVGTLGLEDMKLPKAALVKFASGGVMPGYTPGRDVHQFWSPTAGGLALSGGEAIMRPEFTRLVGGAAGVDALNAAARNGRLPFGDGEGNFFGDVWDNISKAASVAWEFLTNPAQAIKSHVIDGIIRPLTADQNIFGKTMGGLAEKTLMGFVDLFKDAAPKATGTKGMGWEAMWKIVQNAIPGVIKTSDYRPGARTVNGGQSYHGMGRAIDLIPASMATFDAVARLFPNASELIYSPAGGRQLLNGKPFNGWSDAVRAQHYNHVHLAMASGGVVPKLYDQGGWLPHGGLAVNKTGKPEAVLTPSESAALKKGVGGALINGNVTFQSSGDFDSDLGKLTWELRKIGRGSRG